MTPRSKSLLVIGTHPIQYHAPVYKALDTKWGLPVEMIYASDLSVSGYFDKDFRSHITWDVDLFASSDRCVFLSRSPEGTATDLDGISAKGLFKELKRYSPGAVLITGYFPAFHLQAFYQASRLRCPILFRAETTDFIVRGIRRRLRDMLLRRLYARCARLLPIGVRSYAHYKQLACPDEKLVLSPYCVDTSPFRCDEAERAQLRRATRDEMGIPKDRIVLLFSGKLVSLKRPRMLLEAVRRLPCHERGRISLVFMGNGPELEVIRAEASQEPSIPAVFPGFKLQKQLSSYYHAADLLVLPSKSETWGLVVNEALHHGVPCIVTDTVGCAPDLVRPGLTGEISSGSATSLSNAMMRALSLIGSEKVRSRCRELVANYTVDKAAAGIFCAYQQVTQDAS